MRLVSFAGLAALAFKPPHLRYPARVHRHPRHLPHHAHVPADPQAVPRTRQDAVPAGVPVARVHLAHVARQDHDGAPRAQVPDAAGGVGAAGGEERARGVEGEGVDGAGVTFGYEERGGCGCGC